MSSNGLLIEGADEPLDGDEVVAEASRESREVRVLRPDRHQLRLVPTDLDSLLVPEHPARAVWDFVSQLDLTRFYGRVESIEGRAGRPAIDPAILLSLWVLAISQSVGSARMLAELCEDHVAYRWIVGGVGVTRTPLSEFRTEYGEEIDDLLTQIVGVLMSQDLVKLERTAQDGMRVRASAGAPSFRRRETLESCLEEARRQVEDLRDELDDDPGEPTRRQRAARKRATADRERRVKEALSQWDDVRRRKRMKKGADPDQVVRVSTTDPEARVMKMADGGFRPAYNVQLTTDTSSQIVLGADVTSSGGDMSQMTPMLDQIERRFGRLPSEHLVDGGFANRNAIADAAERGCTVYAPEVIAKRSTRKPGERQSRDNDAVAAWRRRMQTEEGKRVYRERPGAIECANAQMRNRGLTRLVVRGLKRVKATVALYAVAHNVLRALVLRRQAALAAG